MIWGVFQDYWHLWPFPSGSSADVLHCSAVQVTLSLYSCGSVFKKIAKNRVPVHTGLNPSHFTNETAFMSPCILNCSNSLQCLMCENWFCLYLPLKIIWNTVSGFCCHSWCGFYSVNSSVTLMNCSNTCKEKYPSKQLFSSLLDLVCTQDTFIVCKDSSSVFMLSGCFCGLLPCPFPKGDWWHTSFGGMQISE